MRAVSKITIWSYRRAIKPVLFRYSPDDVHAGLMKVGGVTQKTPLLKNLPKLWAYKNKALHTKVAGVKFENPVGLSAGFDKMIELPGLLKSVGFGWMTGGSVTLGYYGGNPRPWFVRLPRSRALVVNAGLPSEGTKSIARRVRGYPKQLFDDFPLSVSVAKTNTKACASDDEAIKDYCESLTVFNKLPQVKMLEVNISCPNTFGGEPFTTPDRLDNLLKAVNKLKLTKPIFIKMPISLEWSDFEQLLKVIVKYKIDGVAISNLLKDRSKAKLKDDLDPSVAGNLSGMPTQQISTELVRKTYQAYGDRLVIIGIGGVMSADDAYEKIRAGASLVALITGLIYEGPSLIGDINAGLARLLKRDGFKNISEAVGIDAKLAKSKK